MDYHVLTVTSDDEAAMIESLPSGSPADWRFAEGESLVREFPEDAAIKFSQNYPDARKLRDFMPNILGLLIVSARTRALLTSEGVTNAEFLPVRVLDHKGGVAADDYAIVNLVGAEDAIDMLGSKLTMNHINKTQIGFVDALKLAPARIGKDAKLFRAKTWLRLFLVRDDLCRAFEDAGLTGYRTFPAEGWDGLEI